MKKIVVQCGECGRLLDTFKFADPNADARIKVYPCEHCTREESRAAVEWGASSYDYDDGREL